MPVAHIVKTYAEEPLDLQALSKAIRPKRPPAAPVRRARTGRSHYVNGPTSKAGKQLATSLSTATATLLIPIQVLNDRAGEDECLT